MESNSKRIILNIISGVISFFIVITSIFLVIGITFNSVYIKTTVRGYSMQPTLNMGIETSNSDGDIVYINKYREYEVGDIVVARLDSGENTRSIIKRLIGLEGDVIQIEQEGDNYNLIVNGDILYTKPVTYFTLHGDEGGSYEYYQNYLEYIEIHNGTERIVTNDEGEDCIKINHNECFLMGDNWGETTDSISYGTLNVNVLVGVVDIIIPLGENHFQNLIKSMWEILT